MKKTPITTKFNMFILFSFFFIIEWRWQFALLGFNVPNPYFIVALLFAIVSVVSVVNFLCLRRNISTYSTIAFLLMFYCLCVLFINLPNLLNIDNKGTIVDLGIWAINFGLFFIAQDELLWTKIENHEHYVIILFFIFALTPIFLTFFLGSGLNINFSLRHAIQLINIRDLTNLGVSYQSYGDKLALMSFLVFCLTNNKKLRITLLILSLTSFYVITSKASLLGFVSALILWWSISAINMKNKLKVVVLLFLLLSSVLFLNIVIVESSNLQDSRIWIVKLLATGRKDSSIVSRREIQAKNQEVLASRLILGDYKFDVKIGRPGTYTLNVTSLIEYYGIFYFIAFISFWTYLLILNIKSKRNSVLRNYTVLSMLYFSVLMLVARAGSGYLTYWTLGCATTSLAIRDFKADTI